MRIRLDPWPVDTADGQLSLKPFDGELIDVEYERWGAVAPRPIPERLRTVYVVDGKPRMEARLLLEDDAGQASFGGYGAYVAGTVSLCPHGSRAAELLEVKAERLLAHGAGPEVEAARLSPRNPHTGELLYTPIATQGDHPDAPQHAVLQAMLAREQQLSHGQASQVPFDESDDREALTALTLQDGTLRSRNLGGAVVGCVKTLQTMYLPLDRVGLLADLKPGERTPILYLRYPNGRITRFTWYVRLCEPPFYLHPMSGVMRLEMYAPDEPDFVPPSVKAIANLSGTLLCRLASHPHKDPRAPQNLIPTGALEQAMTRAMGSRELVVRRIRAHIAELLNGAGLSAQGAVA